MYLMCKHNAYLGTQPGYGRFVSLSYLELSIESTLTDVSRNLGAPRPMYSSAKWMIAGGNCIS